MARQNKFTIEIRYSRSSQIVTWRGVGQYGRINMSTLAHRMSPEPSEGGTTKAIYWSAILNTVAADVLANA